MDKIDPRFVDTFIRRILEHTNVAKQTFQFNRILNDNDWHILECIEPKCQSFMLSSDKYLDGTAHGEHMMRCLNSYCDDHIDVCCCAKHLYKHFQHFIYEDNFNEENVWYCNACVPKERDCTPKFKCKDKDCICVNYNKEALETYMKLDDDYNFYEAAPIYDSNEEEHFKF